MSKEAVVKHSKVLLADTYALYLKTQNYHWNVTGPQFHSLHKMFEEQYTDLAEAVDEIAEHIRGMGVKAPATFTDFNDMKTIADGDVNEKAEQMVKDLAQDQAKIIKTLTAVLKSAQEIDDEVTIGIVIERITVHEKNKWMLDSSL